jgi:hypothetical protein
MLQHTDASSFSNAALIFTDPILMMRVVLTMATPSSLERGGKPQGLAFGNNCRYCWHPEKCGFGHGNSSH